MKVKEGVNRIEYDSDITIEAIPAEILARSLSRLDLFVGFLESRVPDDVPKIARTLLDMLRGIDVDPDMEYPTFDYESQNLDEYLELSETSMRVTREMLNYKMHSEENTKNKVIIPFRNYLMSIVPANYMMVASMVDVLGREKAISLYKEFVDYATDEMDTTRKFESLEDLHNGYFEGEKGPNCLISCLPKDGKLVVRVDMCSWQMVLKPYEDPELAYLTSCYYDFHAAEVMNPNFRLTRTKTLMQGDGYCDFCWHDKRQVESIEHPGEDFWNSLDDSSS